LQLLFCFFFFVVLSSAPFRLISPDFKKQRFLNGTDFCGVFRNPRLPF
jgi:hypothetical protein